MTNNNYDYTVLDYEGCGTQWKCTRLKGGKQDSVHVCHRPHVTVP